MSEVDARVGYVEGWKVLTYAPPTGRLTSPVRATEWKSPVMEAKCKRTVAVDSDHTYWLEEEHSPDCTCGLYATKNLDELVQYITDYQYRDCFHVLARVRGYGKVTEGDRAWRSERMEVLEVCPIDPMVRWKTRRTTTIAFAVFGAVSEIMALCFGIQWMVPYLIATTVLLLYMARKRGNIPSMVTTTRYDPLSPEITMTDAGIPMTHGIPEFLSKYGTSLEENPKFENQVLRMGIGSYIVC